MIKHFHERRPRWALMIDDDIRGPRLAGTDGRVCTHRTRAEAKAFWGHKKAEDSKIVKVEIKYEVIEK